MGLLSGLKAQSKSILVRLTQATVEGVTFPFGGRGRALTVLVQTALVAKRIGPASTLSVVVKALPLCAAGRAAFFFITTLPQKIDADQEALDNFWGMDPPGPLGESGAWTVVRELAQTMSKGGEHLPDSEEMETLPFHELAVRLCFKFDDGQNRPDVDEEVEGASQVDDGLLDLMGRQLHYANLVYEGQQDPSILDMLKDDGFGLNFFKPEAEWQSEGAHKPAFFLATNNNDKQLLLSIRGTSEMQDVMADVTAVPKEYDNTGKDAHSGMGNAALWLLERVLPLAQAVDKAGYTIILTGHSLGGGTAALLGLSLRNRGISRVQGYGFATPPCMTQDLAAQCKDWFTDVAFRDDVVSRFGPQSLAALHAELREYEWEDAAKERGPHNPMLGNASKLAKLARKLSSWKPAEGEIEQQDKKMKQTEEKLQEYKPCKPGRVIYCYRAQPELEATEPPQLQRALVDGMCPQLRTIHINAFMVQDHIIPSYFTAIGRNNPVEELRKKEAEEEQQKKEQEEEDQEED